MFKRTIVGVLSFVFASACGGVTDGETVASLEQPLLCAAHERAVLATAVEQAGGTCGPWQWGTNAKTPGFLKLDTTVAYYDLRTSECDWIPGGGCYYSGGTFSSFFNTAYCYKFFPAPAYYLDVLLYPGGVGTVRRYDGVCDSTYDVTFSVVPY